MGRFWSILFLSVPVLGVAVFLLAATDTWPLQNLWFPEDVSEHGHIIDGLFHFILCLTGAIFVGTGLALFLFLWRYDANRNRKMVQFTHGSHTLEVVWSIIPAATLLFIAVYQMDTWAGAKVKRPLGADGIAGTVDDRPVAEVTGAAQFEWRIRYPGPDQQLGTPDDLFTVNDLHLPVNEDAILAIKSQDVLHSFFLPNFRVKQDLVPGMKQFVWFKPVKKGVYDIVCAELCGWGHYKMKGRLTIESRAEFQEFLRDLAAEQNLSEYPAG